MPASFPQFGCRARALIALPLLTRRALTGAFGGAEDDGVVVEVGVHVSQRRQEVGEELVGRPARLTEGGVGPEVELGGHDFGRGGKGGGRVGGAGKKG